MKAGNSILSDHSYGETDSDRFFERAGRPAPRRRGQSIGAHWPELLTIAGKRLGTKRAGIHFFFGPQFNRGRAETDADWVSVADIPDREADLASGFTLLEVVIALAIAALALIGLFRASSDGIMAIEVSARYEEAVQRAESHLAQLAGAADLSPGEADGDDGSGYRWHTRIRPLTVQPPKIFGSAALALLDIDVMISWGGRGRQRSVALHTRRLGTVSVGE